ncbi:MAG TPA: response regulator transcription factor [Armatimonadota bacterium]|jgi:two-component system copper resistance phosphate regulon response regulator CusR
MRVLVIEDETAILRVVKRGLEQAGFVVDTAEDGRAGFDAAMEGVHALIVLDLMLPKMDGWTVCEELRRNCVQTPILMLTARGTVQDRVHGLDIGADDYLPKPFDFSELLARMRALLRRDKVHRSRVFQVADLEVDTGRRRVTRAGVEIMLSRREYDLLEALAANEGQVLTREIIQENVWGDDESYSNTVDVYIGLLRKKIDNGHADRLIHTVRGFGYALRRPEGTEAAG